MAVSAASPIFGPPSVSEALFVKRLRAAKSPAAEEGAAIYRRMVAAGLDPLVALGQFAAESGLGTRGYAVRTRNWGNILFYEWTRKLGAVDFAPGNGFHYSEFPTWTDGARAYVALMKRYRERGIERVEQMAARWLGAKVGSDRANRYVRNIVGACARFAGPAAPPKPAPAPRAYVVQPGDSLSAIARRELGSSARWREIYAIPSNRALIGDDPGRIRPGQRLFMPDR
jgi:nucleoid-associated protein YgaU